MLQQIDNLALLVITQCGTDFSRNYSQKWIIARADISTIMSLLLDIFIFIMVSRILVVSSVFYNEDLVKFNNSLHCRFFNYELDVVAVSL